MMFSCVLIAALRREAGGCVSGYCLCHGSEQRVTSSELSLGWP